MATYHINYGGQDVSTRFRIEYDVLHSEGFQL